MRCVNCTEEAMPHRPECPRCEALRVTQRDSLELAERRFEGAVERERVARKRLKLPPVVRVWRRR